MAMTRQTFVAAFRSSAEAQAAAQDLQSAGVPREDIFLEDSSAESMGTRSEPEYRSRSGAHEGGITGWFKSVFGLDESPEQTNYERAMGQGNCVLSVDAMPEQVESIEAILNRHNPIDIHDEDTGASRMADATAATADPIATSAGLAGFHSTETASLTEEGREVGDERARRGGVRVYTPQAEYPTDPSLPSTGRMTGSQNFTEPPAVSTPAGMVNESSSLTDTVQHPQSMGDSVHSPETGRSGWSDRETGTSVRDSSANFRTYDDQDYQRDFDTRFGSMPDAKFDDYSPAYRYGSDAASDTRYQGRSFEDVESDLRADYERRNPGSAWERMKGSVRYGWDKLTNKM